MKSKSKSKVTRQRDAQAKVRLYARQMRSDEQQLELLEKRGAGNCKEAQKIRERLESFGERKARRARAGRS